MICSLSRFQRPDSCGNFQLNTRSFFNISTTCCHNTMFLESIQCIYSSCVGCKYKAIVSNVMHINPGSDPSNAFVLLVLGANIRLIVSNVMHIHKHTLHNLHSEACRHKDTTCRVMLEGTQNESLWAESFSPCLAPFATPQALPILMVFLQEQLHCQHNHISCWAHAQYHAQCFLASNPLLCFPFSASLSLNPSINPSIYLSTSDLSLSIAPSLCIWIYISVYLAIHLSIYLSIYSLSVSCFPTVYPHY